MQSVLSYKDRILMRVEKAILYCFKTQSFLDRPVRCGSLCVMHVNGPGPVVNL